MRYLLITILLISSFECIGQKYDVIPDWKLTTYNESRSEDISGNKFIIKDSLGYLWTFNPSSIERFDGESFKSYFTYDEYNEESDVRYVHGLNVGLDGSIYATSGNGLFIYNREKDRFERMMENFEPYAEGLLPEFTWMVDQDSVLYISSFVGLYAYHVADKTWEYFDLRPDVEHKNGHHSLKVIWYMERDHYQPHIINIFGKAMYHQLDTRTNTILKSIRLGNFIGISVHAAKQTKPNEFYLSTFGSGVLRFNSETEKTEIFYNVSNQYINDKPFRVTFSAEIINDHFVATGRVDEIVFIDTASGEATNYPDLGEKHYDLKGFDDDLYWCTMYKGLVKLEEYDYFTYKLDLPDDFYIRTAIPNHDESILALHGIKEGLFFYDFKKNNLSQIESIKGCSNIVFDEYLNAYISETEPGVFQIIDGSSLEVLETIDIGNKTFYLDFLITEEHWIINHSGLFTVYDKRGKVVASIEIPEKYYKFFQLGGSWVTQFDEKRYILQNPATLLIVDIEKGTYKEYPEFHNQGIVGTYTLDQKNFYVVMERHGIVKYTYDADKDEFDLAVMEHTIEPFTPHTHVFQKDGIIWLRGNNFVKVFNMKTELYEKDEYYPISTYTTFNDPNAGTSGFWLGSDKKIIHVIRNSKSKKIESLNLESILVENERIDNKSELSLPPNVSSIRMKWSTPYYGDHDKMNYYVRLEGQYDTWEKVGTTTEKVYLGLDPGKYKFHVKAVAPGTDIYTSQLLQFEILPPWYSTWWFRTIAALFIIGLLYTLYRYRINQITHQESLEKKIATLELKALKAQLNPHFIFNSLNSIKRLIQKNDNKVAIEYLLLFSSMIRNVLDLSDKKSVSIREELEFSEQYLKMEKLRFKKNFEYEVYAGDEYFMDEYSIPTMILQPHLENAIWHGIMPLEDRKGKVRINVFEIEDYIEIRIEDNGIGRKASAEINEKQRSSVHRSMGQSLSIDRLRLAALQREQEITTEIIDKDPNGDNPGTIIKIKLKK